MPTRKISEREKLTMYARSAGDDELDEAIEILSIEKRVRGMKKPVANTRQRNRAKDVPPGPPNPPKPTNDNPQG